MILKLIITKTNYWQNKKRYSTTYHYNMNTIIITRVQVIRITVIKMHSLCTKIKLLDSVLYLNYEILVI